MFENNGEEYEGARSRCPGDGACDLWDSTAGRPKEERELSCADCKRCSGPPSEEEAAIIPDDDPAIADLVEEIADIILTQDAGSPTDWTAYPPEYLWLAGQWRAAEKMIAALRHHKLLQALTHAGT